MDLLCDEVDTFAPEPASESQRRPHGTPTTPPATARSPAPVAGDAKPTRESRIAAEGRAFLHTRIEWVGEVHRSADEPEISDFGPTAAAQLEEIQWNGFTMRVPPLALQEAVSQRRGLTDRVERIRQQSG